MVLPSRGSKYNARSDHDLMVELNVKFDELVHIVENHETRIRANERWRWIATGAFCIVSGALGYFIHLL